MTCGASIVFAGVLDRTARAAASDPSAACERAKMRCVRRLGKDLFKCQDPALLLATPASPACVAAALARFADPAKCCGARAEARPPCPTTGDTPALVTNEAVAGACAAMDRPPTARRELLQHLRGFRAASRSFGTLPLSAASRKKILCDNWMRM